MKRMIIIMFVCGLFCLFYITADAETVKTQIIGDYECSLFEDGTLGIKKYYGQDKELSIPSIMNGKKVTFIHNAAFS